MLSYVFSLAGILGKNKVLGNIAAHNSSTNAILVNLTENELVRALKSKGLVCVTNYDGQMIELSVLCGFDEKSIMLNVGWLAARSYLVNVDLGKCSYVTGKEENSRTFLLRTSPFDEISGIVPWVR